MDTFVNEGAKGISHDTSLLVSFLAVDRFVQ